jgi:hypothetical protein
MLAVRSTHQHIRPARLGLGSSTFFHAFREGYRKGTAGARKPRFIQRPSDVEAILAGLSGPRAYRSLSINVRPISRPASRP